MEIDVRGLRANTGDNVRGVLPKRQSGCYRRGFAGYCLEGIAIHLDPRGDPQHLELQWFTVALQSQNLVISAVNRPPSANNDVLQKLEKMTQYGPESISETSTSITKTG